MATLKELATKRSDIFYIDPRAIRVRDGFNVRDWSSPDNAAHVAALAASIAQVGVLEPLTVYHDAGEIWLTDGECRLRGALQALANGAEIVAVPVKSEGRAATESDRMLSLLVRNSGKRLAPLEQAEVFKRLDGFGWSIKQIAERGGVSESAVRASLDLAAAPEPVKELVASGRVSANLAAKAVKQEGAKAAEVLYNAVDSAVQKGRAKATVKDLGDAPKGARVNVRERTREILDDCTLCEDQSDLDEVKPQFGVNKRAHCLAIVVKADEWEELKRMYRL